jgi:hypothetical protein
MDLQPVITVNSAKPLTLNQALKAIRRFQSNSSAGDAGLSLTRKEEKSAVLSDDFVDKLEILTNEWKRLTGSSESAVEVQNKKRKREKDNETIDTSEKAAKKNKKEKKEKKGKDKKH